MVGCGGGGGTLTQPPLTGARHSFSSRRKERLRVAHSSRPRGELTATPGQKHKACAPALEGSPGEPISQLPGGLLPSIVLQSITTPCLTVPAPQPITLHFNEKKSDFRKKAVWAQINSKLYNCGEITQLTWASSPSIKMDENKLFKLMCNWIVSYYSCHVPLLWRPWKTETLTGGVPILRNILPSEQGKQKSDVSSRATIFISGE